MIKSNGKLQGKVAIVTGAASGMGFAIAQRFVNEGARVICTDVDADRGATSTSLLGDGACFVQHDVSSETDWKRVVDLAESSFGRLDILVNNAGIYLLGSVEDLEVSAWDRTMEVNLRGPFLGCRTALGLMKRSGAGSIINIASIAAFKPVGCTVAYNASKAGVALMTQSIALHCAESGYGIRVNSINPGIIRTTMMEKVLSETDDAEALMASYMQMVPMGRIAEPAEIAAMATFLASDEATYITGAAFNVDGGVGIN